MMRAWPESAAAGWLPKKSKLNRMSKVEGISLREAIFTPSRGRDLHPLDDEKKGQVTHDAPFTIVSPGDGDVKGRLHRRTPVFFAPRHSTPACSTFRELRFITK